MVTVKSVSPLLFKGDHALPFFLYFQGVLRPPAATWATFFVSFLANNLYCDDPSQDQNCEKIRLLKFISLCIYVTWMKLEIRNMLEMIIFASSGEQQAWTESIHIFSRKAQHK